MLTLDFLKIEMSVVNHIGEVDLIVLLQNRLIMVIHLFCNIKKQQGARIVRFFTKNLKPGFIITSGFVLLYEIHHEKNKFNYVLIFSGLNNLFINLIKISWFENKTFRFKAFFQMIHKRATVII